MRTSAKTVSRPGVVFAWILGVLLVIGLTCIVWVGVRAGMAYSHMQSARSELVLAAQSAEDSERAAALIRSAGADLRSAGELTNDVVWRAAEHLPWIGPQLDAFARVSAAGQDVAASALEPLSTLASTVSLVSLRPVNGALDLAALDSVQSAAAEAASGLESASHRLEGIDRDALLRPVSQGIHDVEDQIAAASATARAATLLPAMLGAEHPRTWLLLFQNNAELRSLGGMPGATAVITADDGRLTLAAQGDASIPRFDDPVVDLGSDLLGIYGERPGVWFSGTTILPDFAEAAPIAREMWKRAHGVEADSVISLDPFALSYMLRATGPITLPTGETLTSENAVDVLLNQVYLNYPDPVVQNKVFASAAAMVFAAFASGAAEPTALISALAQAAEERRLLLWSSDPAEQALFDDTDLSGALPKSDADAARFGVYLNDGTGSKLGPYLDVDATVEWDACSPEGEPVGNLATLTLNLRNTAPADAATSLPPSIAGGSYGVPAGTLRVVTYVYLPKGATLKSADGAPSAGFGGGFDGDYRVLSHQVDLAPGDASTATVTADLEGVSSTIAADITPAFGLTSISTTCASD